jgi:molecular chaperone IbpA
MRNFDFTPLFRSTIGFDRMVDLLDQAVDFEAKPGYPPYNIEKTGADSYRLTMVVAGFKPEELSIVAEGVTLSVTGEKMPTSGEEFLYRGFAERSFKRSFHLAEYMKVAGAKLENGLLWIELKREVPEAMKPRTINIVSKMPLAAAA